MEREDFIPEESSISPDGLLVRRAYCINMRYFQGKKNYGAYIIPQYDGGTSQSGRRYENNVWDKIAEALVNNEIDAEEYIEYVFNTQKSITNPNTLMSPTILNRFKQLIQGEERPTIWEFEENKLLTEITIKSCTMTDGFDVLKRVLLDDTIYVSPLVRYSFGCKSNANFVVEPLFDEALRQYRRRRFFYDRYYKDNIPEELRERIADGKIKQTARLS